MRKYKGLGAINRVHFIGIGGVSMSGLAEILAKDGFVVSGSDWTAKPSTDHLRSIGIEVAIGPNDAKNISADMELIVYTAAVKPDNPERIAAEAMDIPTMVRGELLGAILQGFDYPVCIAGSHGKTSTTALVTAITIAAGLDPTVNIGGFIGDKNNYIGSSPYFVLEACEYSNTFHHVHPHIGVILNIDIDHMDFYGSMDAIIESFAKFAGNIRPGGTLIIQEGIEGFDRIVAGLDCEIITFHAGVRQDAPPSLKGISRQYWMQDVAPSSQNPEDTAGAAQIPRGVSPCSVLQGPCSVPQNPCSVPPFDVMIGQVPQARVSLPLPGEYNMNNALAAFAVGQKLDIDSNAIAAALSQVKGVKRRYEYKGEVGGVTIIDDYAHHPTEIRACLEASRKGGYNRIVCLFQPHTYTRTRDLFDDFTKAFGEADITLFLPIYAAREPFDPSISSAMLAEKVAARGEAAVSCENFEEAEAWLRGKLMPGDLLITMGAGEAHFIGEALLAK